MTGVQSERVALRDAYGEALLELGKKHPDVVVLDADLSESTKTCKFGTAFPERFFNMGIAEQNMMGAAAGLAACKFVPFASTFALFATERAFEQIRNSIAYPRLNVKIAATHAGLSAGKDGGSHEAIEDISLMRSVPNMTVIVPCDAVEVEQAVEAAYAYDGPVYLRLSRLELPIIHSADYTFHIGKGEVLADGEDAAIMATGAMVPRALEASERLRRDGIHAAVLNFATIKPIDKELILHYAKKTGKIVTAEEHTMFGGLFSAVAEIVAEHDPAAVAKVAIADRFGQTGSPEELFQEYGLTVENIIRKVKAQLPGNGEGGRLFD
ncbi:MULTISPECIES: transketolase family protein [unclassified Sporolactobacillus]|uniref:transketolase family protein n=1 Tax=unclassified Sporolactobacillus TaxID=2628533 RepID=UPI0023678F3F|nr:transketolase family protein [Sporolactobacillus sp. CQH2019]MDD9149712.1 transketolase family protein [Sporolactobacillus sp. CQH2019]